MTRSSHAGQTPAMLAAAMCAAFLMALTALPWPATAQGAPAATATPVPGTGSVAGSAWHDVDADGERDAEEGPLAGVQVQAISADGQSISVTLSTDAAGAYLIAGLLPGDYTVRATPPAGYHLTTRETYEIRLTVGAVLAVNFGAQYVPTPTPSQTPPPLLDVANAEQAFCAGVYAGLTITGRSDVRSYGCRSAWDESGPEVVYRIELEASQPITASLISASADLDLFLLRYAYPDSCVAAGDTYLTHTAEPGVYFLAVDGYRGAAGSYVLRVDCALGIQATATPTFTASPTPTPGPTSTPTATRGQTPLPPQMYLPLLIR